MHSMKHCFACFECLPVPIDGTIEVQRRTWSLSCATLDACCARPAQNGTLPIHAASKVDTDNAGKIVPMLFASAPGLDPDVKVSGPRGQSK